MFLGVGVVMACWSGPGHTARITLRCVDLLEEALHQLIERRGDPAAAPPHIVSVDGVHDPQIGVGIEPAGELLGAMGQVRRDRVLTLAVGRVRNGGNSRLTWRVRLDRTCGDKYPIPQAGTQPRARAVEDDVVDVGRAVHG